MANELRRSPSGPLANQSGTARIEIEQQTFAIPDGLATTDLVPNGSVKPTFVPLTTAEGSPVNLEAQFDDCKVGDIITISGSNNLIGPSNSTSAYARFALAQGGTPEAPPTVFVGDDTSIHGGPTEGDQRSAFVHRLTITEAGTAIVRVEATSLSNASAGANVTCETDQPDTGLTRGYFAQLARLTNVNDI